MKVTVIRDNSRFQMVYYVDEVTVCHKYIKGIKHIVVDLKKGEEEETKLFNAFDYAVVVGDVEISGE